MKLSFYTVAPEYCDYLRENDPRVPYTMDDKSTRPFVGIVFDIGVFHYYAPLTSPKAKHLSMKNQIDFLKINEGKWGAINFNNMIPVPAESLQKIDMKTDRSDSASERVYKNLLSNQLSWCNANRDGIYKQAEKLYNLIKNGKAWDSLAKRCCDFGICEALCEKYHS